MAFKNWKDGKPLIQVSADESGGTILECSMAYGIWDSNHGFCEGPKLRKAVAGSTAVPYEGRRICLQVMLPLLLGQSLGDGGRPLEDEPLEGGTCRVSRPQLRGG
jgi:hypothetical protein